MAIIYDLRYTIYDLRGDCKTNRKSLAAL